MEDKQYQGPPKAGMKAVRIINTGEIMWATGSKIPNGTLQGVYAEYLVDENGEFRIFDWRAFEAV